MFQKHENTVLNEVKADQLQERNYVIQPNDLLELNVYTKKGEFLVDPEYKLLEGPSNNQIPKPNLKYLVQENGQATLPMVGTVELSGLTLFEAEQKLIEEYQQFYTEPFVKINYLNKRVTVLGAYGNQVIDLTNENVRVAEVIAMTEGMEREGKSYNIRLLRGEESYMLDFSSIEGFRKNNIVVENGDVIYIEPVRRPFTEFIRDNGPVISVLSSLTSLIVVILSLN